ncbi:hypothetical protein LXA43DRAFT_1128376 [Ganoderma leucocontextum]|nr:hypothetical protein LXA43DRAFT_1128376 [Ganoderma leucocontextum]
MSEISDLTMTPSFMGPGKVFSNTREQFHHGIGKNEGGMYNQDYEAASKSFMQTLLRDLQCTKLGKAMDNSLRHDFLNVSTRYDGEQTESIPKGMNDLAHLLLVFLVTSTRSSTSPRSFVPIIGPKLKRGEQ